MKFVRHTLPRRTGQRRKAKRVTLARIAEICDVSRHVAGAVLHGINQTKSARNLKIIATAKRLGFTCQTLAGEGKPSCPSCGACDFKVMETRQAPDEWLRIRKCNACDTRFMTSEVIVNERNYLK